MLVAEEEHESHWIVQLVHLLEVWNLIEITHVEDGKVLDAVRDPYAASGKGVGKGEEWRDIL